MWQGMQASKSFRSWDHRKILEVFTVFEPNQLADFHKIMSLLSPVLVFKYTTQLLQLSNMGNCYSCCRAKCMDEFINWSLKSGAASRQKKKATSCVRTVRHFIVIIWYMRHATTTKAVTASPFNVLRWHRGTWESLTFSARISMISSSEMAEAKSEACKWSKW